MNWNDFYKAPFSLDEGCGRVIAQPNPYTRDTWAWDWIDNQYISEYPIENYRGADLAEGILRYINGESEYRPDFKWSKDDNSIIYINGEPCIEIRGWGCLTGVGGYNLSNEDACKIQNDFADFLVNKLNGDI